MAIKVQAGSGRTRNPWMTENGQRAAPGVRTTTAHTR